MLPGSPSRRRHRQPPPWPVEMQEPLPEFFRQYLADLREWLRPHKHDDVNELNGVVVNGPIRGGIKIKQRRGPRYGGSLGHLRKSLLNLNVMASALAAVRRDEWRTRWMEENPGQPVPRKVLRRGTKTTVQDAATADAVEWVNAHYGSLPGCMLADRQHITSRWDDHSPSTRFP